MEAYYTEEYKKHLLDLQIAEQEFKKNPNAKTATVYSNLKNNPLEFPILTAEGIQIQKESREKRRQETHEYHMTVITELLKERY